jgi:hypothetical protein
MALLINDKSATYIQTRLMSATLSIFYSIRKFRGSAKSCRRGSKNFLLSISWVQKVGGDCLWSVFCECAVRTSSAYCMTQVGAHIFFICNFISGRNKGEVEHVHTRMHSKLSKARATLLLHRNCASEPLHTDTKADIRPTPHTLSLSRTHVLLSNCAVK